MGDKSDEADRTRSFDLMWGPTARPARGPRPELSRDAIVAAAIQAADREGLGALSMARVAAALDASTMALYRYVPGKHELIDLMIDASMGPAPAPAGGGWQAEVTHWARLSLGLFLQRPWLLEAIMRYAPIGPNWLAWFDAAVGAFAGSGLAPAQVLSAVLLVDGHVRASAQVMVGVTSSPEWGQNFGQVLGVALSDPRYANLAALAQAGGFEPGGEAPFDFGLRHILEGIETCGRSKPALSPG